MRRSQQRRTPSAHSDWEVLRCCYHPGHGAPLQQQQSPSCHRHHGRSKNDATNPINRKKLALVFGCRFRVAAVPLANNLYSSSDRPQKNTIAQRQVPQGEDHQQQQQQHPTREERFALESVKPTRWDHLTTVAAPFSTNIPRTIFADGKRVIVFLHDIDSCTAIYHQLKGRGFAVRCCTLATVSSTSANVSPICLRCVQYFSGDRHRCPDWTSLLTS